MNRLRWLFAALLAVALIPAGASAQARGGVVAGQVVDKTTLQPIPNVQVVVAGTTLGALTNAEGRFRITGVEPGQQTVRATRIGFGAAERQVEVNTGQTITADFSLSATAVELGGLVISATGRAERKREIGVSVADVKVEDINLAPVNSAAGLIQGRAAGVTVLQSGGTTGTGARIRIRGSASVSLSNEPLLIIDGIRVDNGANSNSLGVGGQSPSRLNDINPDDIESIEILKGPAAAALYGTAAANGVIQIRTKKGAAGETRFRAFAEYGSLEETTEFPANFAGLSDGPFGRFCVLPFVAQGLCEQTEIVSFNPLEDPRTTPFREGNRQQFGASVSGGTEGTTYYVSADYEEEAGIYEASNLERVNLRANIRGELSENADLTVATGYVTSDLQLPQNDNNILGLLSGGLLGSPTFDDPEVSPFVSGLFPEDLMAIDTRQEIDRFTGSALANYRPMDWLSFNGTIGLDLLSRFDNETVPPGAVDFGTLIEGERSANRFRIANYTANGSATATYGIMEGLNGITTVGVQYYREIFEGTEAFGARLLAGTGSLGATTARFAVDESTSEQITLGGLFRQQFAWNDNLFGSLSLRADENSAFGEDFELQFYPAVDASYVALENENTSVRLRGAWGRAGLAPGPLDAVQFFSPVAVTVAGTSVPGFTFGGIGNQTLRPEVSTEFEVGTDVGFLNNRFGLELTYYNKTSEDALVFRDLAPSLGVGQGRFDNLGQVQNHGFEAALNAQVVNTGPVQFSFNLTGSTTENELIDLGKDEQGKDIEPIIFGLGGNTQRFQEGFPLGSFFQRPILGFEDVNGDGLLAPDEVQLGDTAVFLGSPFPEREVQFMPQLTFFSALRLQAMFDYRGGFKQFNSTEEFRCGAFLICEAIVDPSTPLEEQARAVAAFEGTAAGFIEDASFVKLRELSLTFDAPASWANAVWGQGLSVTLAGRNLATWTDYTGADPEVNFAGQGNFITADFLTQPPVRYYTVRVDYNF